MSIYSLSHLADQTLLSDVPAVAVSECAPTAVLLAYLAEIDARQLYLQVGYTSMFAYCVGELPLWEQAAFKRIRAARTARQFPAIFEAVAEGRLCLSAVIMLAPYLTPENADQLLAASEHKSKSKLEHLLAERFPRPDLPAQVTAISPPLSLEQLSPGTVWAHSELVSPGTVEPPAPRPKVTPVSPERFGFQTTIGRETHEKLLYIQSLLGHQVPTAELDQVLERSFAAYIVVLEKRKFAATSRPRPGRQRASTNPRHIPADVKRQVWERDQGQCTFVGDTGRRCSACTRLEFDHVDPVARGGRATVGNMRLRCRPHNQYEAERTFGAEFMRHKRQQARDAASARAGARATSAETPAARAQAAAAEQARDVMAGLRELGFSASEARRAAEFSATLHDVTLEERMRAALSCFSKPSSGASPRIIGTLI